MPRNSYVLTAQSVSSLAMFCTKLKDQGRGVVSLGAVKTSESTWAKTQRHRSLRMYRCEHLQHQRCLNTNNRSAVMSSGGGGYKLEPTVVVRPTVAGALAKLRKASSSVRPSVRPPGRKEQLGFLWTHFYEILHFRIYRKYSNLIKI